MRKKELKNIAKKIALYEAIIRDTSSDREEVRVAQDKIIALSNDVTELEDMIMIDDMVKEILENNV